MMKRVNKLIAPVIVTVAVALYVVGFAAAVFYFDPPVIVRIVFLAPPVIATGVMIYVLIERIKEINGGEEDDLGKY
jgi:hypothetical protein